MRRESPITHGGDTKVILTLVFLHTEGLLKIVKEEHEGSPF
jgi:hypothetical protein